MDKSKSDLRQTKAGAVWVSKMELAEYINYSTIADKFFERTPAWILQRLSGYVVNGKKAVFTESEYQTLAKAYRDIAGMLVQNADYIEKSAIE